MIWILLTQGQCFVFSVGTADRPSITERNPPLPVGGTATNWPARTIMTPVLPVCTLRVSHAPLSPSNWSALYWGCGSPVMSWILLKANNGLQTSRVGDRRFFRFKRNVQHLWTAITWHHLNDITHQQVVPFNQWSRFSNIFLVHLKIFLVLRDTRAALSLPVEHARHDTMDPQHAQWTRTCWMVMGQWL